MNRISSSVDNPSQPLLDAMARDAVLEGENDGIDLLDD